VSADFDVLHTFRFEVTLESSPLFDAPGDPPVDGAFSECTGLEGTMEQKVIKEGGRNYGVVQRAGPVTFATVILKRGISPGGSLAKWFMKVARGDYGNRASVRIALKAPPAKLGDPPRDVAVYHLENALPVKFKAADFNARATEVGIEELHLVHEGLTLEVPS
jgi:phage tail-like protein